MSDRVEASGAGLGGGTGVTEPERMGAIVRLRDRYANDEVSLDEFSRALDGVLGARTARELSVASPSREIVAPASRVSLRETEALHEHLVAGEEILWVEKPQPSLILTRDSVKAIGPFVAFALLLEMSGIPGSPGWVMLDGAILLLAFIVVGFGGYNLIERFNLKAARTVYAITTRRIIRIVRHPAGAETDSKLIEALPRMKVTQDRRGRGTLTFGERPAVWSRTGRLRAPNPLSSEEPIGFFNIPEPIAVARLISSLQAHQQE